MTVKTDVPIEVSFVFCVMSALAGILAGFLLGAASALSAVDNAENDSLQSRIERLEAAEQ